MMPAYKISAIAALCGLLAACAPSGYYDSTGQYRSYGASDSFNHDKPMTGTPQTQAVVPGGGPASTNTYVTVPPGASTTVVTNPDGSTTSLVNTPAPQTTVTTTTTNQGYYDSNGNFIRQ